MRDEYRRHIGRPVMVEIEGNTVGGTLAGVTRDTLTLKTAELVAAGRSTPIDGVIVLSRFAVTWVQVAV